jgi:tRNA(Ile)-lysidine synthase
MLRLLPTDWSPDAPALIGVSGGRDSVVLLHALYHAGFQNLFVCHLDHGLREESEADAAFVAELAKKRGLPFASERVDVARLARQKKQSLETAARDARYAFFARCAERFDTRRLWLAHHADDQVETFLFNLLRGAGPGGLSAMSPLSERSIDGTALEIARPLLATWRDEIDQYATKHALIHREDASNADTRFTRNRIRHTVLPALTAAMGRDVRTALWRAAELLRAEDALLSSTPELQSSSAKLGTETLQALPLALRRRLVHAWLQKNGVSEAGYAEVEATLSLLGGKAAKVNLPGGKCARRREKSIFLDTQSKARTAGNQSNTHDD